MLLHTSFLSSCSKKKSRLWRRGRISPIRLLHCKENRDNIFLNTCAGRSSVNCFLIDFENVSADSIKDLSGVQKGDALVVFYRNVP